MRVLPKTGIALEIGSGSGEHAVCFAKALPKLVWLPSDPDMLALASIEAWIRTEHLANVRAPVGRCQTNPSGPAKGADLKRSGHQLTPLG